MSKTGTGYTLVASSGTLASGTSATFNVRRARVYARDHRRQHADRDREQRAPATALTVKVTDATGNVVSGQSVTFAVATGGGSLSATTTSADVNGLATTVWTLGSLGGTQTVTATSGTLSGSPATFTATAT